MQNSESIFFISSLNSEIFSDIKGFPKLSIFLKYRLLEKL